MIATLSHFPSNEDFSRYTFSDELHDDNSRIEKMRIKVFIK
jgi:hypothetical protein